MSVAWLSTGVIAVGLIALVTGCGAGETAGRNRLPDDSLAPLADLTLEHTKNDGDGQAGPVYELMPDPLQVRVMRNGTPIPGVMVQWLPEKPGAYVEPESSKSDAFGDARTAYIAGPTVGFEQVYAAIPGDTAVFLLRATSGPPFKVINLSGDQVTTSDVAFVSGKVVDLYGNGVNDVPVVWRIDSGSAVLEDSFTVSAPPTGGFVNVVLLAPAPSVVVVSATVGGFSPITFQVTRN